MNLHTLIWKEAVQRWVAVASSTVIIAVGVAALVSIRHVTIFSERDVRRQMADLGANMLILPRDASVQDYHAADEQSLTLPEERASEVLLAGLPGVDRVSPRLAVPISLAGKRAVLTGLLPQAELRAQSAWQTVTLRAQAAGCGNASCTSKPRAFEPASLNSDRTIDELGPRDAILGADVARRMNLQVGQSLELLNERFRVIAVLRATGTEDDSRVFAHLHSVQDLSQCGPVVNAIEIMACCEDVGSKLAPQLAQLFPDCKVVTISQLVQAQVGVNKLLSSTSALVMCVVTVFGGASIANTTMSNVRERRRELGMLLAIGATPQFVWRLFLLRAVWIGLAAGVAGAACGTVVAVWFGSAWAGVVVQPLAGVIVAAVFSAVAVAMLAAYLPARRASRLDPCSTLQET